MNYKLICIDLDGTLLDNKGQIHSKTKEILKKLYKKGMHIVISTGRIYSEAKYYSELLGVDSAIIASNGAIIVDQANNKVIDKNIFSNDLVKDILNKVEKYKPKLSIYTSNTLYFGNFRIYLMFIYENIKRKGHKETKIKYVFSNAHLHRILRKEKDQIIKCEVFDFNVKRILKIKDDLLQMKEIEAVNSAEYCIEITTKNVSKGHAVEMLAKHYNIEQNEIMAIGDSENDLTMIQYAGLGVAMKNAPQVIKDHADYITETNENLGVVQAIEKYII